MLNSSKLRFAAALFLAFAAGFLGGCATTASSKEDSGLVQAFLTTALPPDWKGDVAITREDMLMDWDIEAGNVRRDPESGLWVWDWLTYERKSHFAIFSGLTWKSTGKIRMGSPPSRAPK